MNCNCKQKQLLMDDTTICPECTKWTFFDENDTPVKSTIEFCQEKTKIIHKQNEKLNLEYHR